MLLSVRVNSVRFTYPPIKELPKPTKRVGVASAEYLRPHSDSVTRTRHQELEIFEGHLRQLVDAYICKLLTTILYIKVSKRHIVS